MEHIWDIKFRFFTMFDLESANRSSSTNSRTIEANFFRVTSWMEFAADYIDYINIFPFAGELTCFRNPQVSSSIPVVGSYNIKELGRSFVFIVQTLCNQLDGSQTNPSVILSKLICSFRFESL